MIPFPTLAYPVLPAHGADAAYYGRFLAALGEDAAAMGALEELLRPFGLHIWRDEQGWQRQLIAQPLTVTSECDWPKRLRRVGSSLEACPGATALGHGAYDGMNNTPPIANPGQIYATRELAPDQWPAGTSGALSVWIAFVHSFVEIHGQSHLSLDQASVGAGTALPEDTADVKYMPLAFRLSGTAAELFTVAVGAIELRHTPEPISYDPGDLGDPLEAPLSSGGGSGSTSNSQWNSGNESSGGGGSSGNSSSGGSSGGSSHLGSSSDLLDSSISSSSPSSYSSSSEDSDLFSSSSESSSSKIIMPVNVAGELEYIGWCAAEAPNQQLEVFLTVETFEGIGFHGIPDWMLENVHPARPNWQVVSAWCPEGHFVAASIGGGCAIARAAHWQTGEPVDTVVVVRIRCASKASLEPWQDERNPHRRAESVKFHAATRRHHGK